MTFTALIAQEPAPAAAPAPAGGGLGSFLGNPMFMMALMGLFFVVVILPASRRKKKEAAALLASVKPGVKIVTASGIIGTIVSMKDGADEVTIRSEDTKLRVLRSTITRVLGEESEAKA